MRIFKNKDLLFELIKRDIKSRYKQSFLGYVWVILVPLINLLILSVVFSFFIRIETGDIPYTMYLFAGLVPWLFTSTAIVSATTSIVQNTSLITKVALPKEVFPAAAIFSKTIDFSLNFVIMMSFMVYFGVSIKWTMALLPLIFVIHFVLILGIAYILSSINVYFRDVENVIGVFLSMWMYLTPVLYPPEIVPQNLRPFFDLNPMTALINSYRDIILFGRTPSWQNLLYSFVAAFVVFFIGGLIFKRLSRNFADVI